MPRLTPQDKLKKIMSSPKLYIETFIKIINKDGKLVPFKLNEPQLDFYNNMEKYNIILKSRQMGMSVFCLAYALALCICKPNQHCLFLSHSLDSTRMIFNKAKQLYDSIPDSLKPTLEKNNRNELAFSNGSIISCAVIAKKDQARGATLNFVHISELAFASSEYARTQLLAIEQALVSRGKLVIESTANGIGNFYYDLWHNSKNGSTLYKTHFYNYLDGKSMFESEYKLALERFKTMHNREFAERDLTDDERVLMAGDSRFNLAIILWRRGKITNSSEDSFNQEFPISDIVSFLSTNKSIFDTSRINERALHLPTSYTRKSKGSFVDSMARYLGSTLSIYHMPISGVKYAIGVDAGDGVGKDSSSIIVLNPDGIEVASFDSNKIAPHAFSDLVYDLAKYYNNALLVVEKASAGNIVLDRLKHQHGYQNIYKSKFFDERGMKKRKVGFQMTDKTRPLLISAYREAFEEGQILVNSKRVLDQMLTFVANDKTGKIEHIQGGHDDSLIAFMLALFGLSQPHYLT